MQFFCSDPHFGHTNVLAYDNRPFSTIEEHDEALVSNFNKVVGSEDDLYILGDFSFHKDINKIREIISSLNGKKHLIIGNHDTKIIKDRDTMMMFNEVTDYKELYIDKHCTLILSHYPIPCFKNSYYGWVHLYGHVHNTFEHNIMENTKRTIQELYRKNFENPREEVCRMHNVGVMMPYINYVPRTLEEILTATENVENKGI